MIDYHNMTPEQRFSELEQMAVELFETRQWKTKFCNRYGYQPNALQKWKDKGAPEWACVAVRDALSAKRLAQIMEIIESERIRFDG